MARRTRRNATGRVPGPQDFGYQMGSVLGAGAGEGGFGLVRAAWCPCNRMMVSLKAVTNSFIV